jgi:outer membrane protein assembly factor BamD (BamD/ComL family)
MLRTWGLFLLLVPSVVGRSDDSHRRILLASEIEYVAVFLQNDEVEFAQRHLDIIKEQFADQVAIIRYYQGIINYQQEKFDSAAGHFERLLSEALLPESEPEICEYLVYIYCRLSRFDDATALLARLRQRFETLPDWAQDLHLVLGQSMHEHAGDNPEKRQLRDRAMGILIEFANARPDHGHAAWVKYLEAEQQFEWLEAELAKLAQRDQDVTAAGLAPHLHRIARLYERIENGYPDTSYALNAEIRLVYLQELIDELPGNSAP